MKKLFTAIFIMANFLTYAQSTTVVISQVYGGGGSGTATYQSDYVELHNISAVTQDISGFKIMYGSAAGNLGSTATNVFTFPASITIPAGGYVLIASAPSSGLAPLPITPDYTFTLGLSGTNGKVALGTAAMVSNATVLAQPAGAIIDLVGYGSANDFEGTAVVALSGTTAAFRKNNGCTETNNNTSDFTTGTPVPRNASSTAFNCSGGGTIPNLVTGTLTSFGNQALNIHTASQTIAVS